MRSEMSRSRRHTPIIGMACASSEKLDKKTWHSRARTHERKRLALCPDWDTYLTTLDSEVSNPWTMSKDGRQWLDLRKPSLRKYMRK